MKRILILGAGQSSPYMIDYLLTNAEKYDWFVTVGDRNWKLAQERVDNHPRGHAIYFDIHDGDMLNMQISKADVVVHMLPPTYQHLVARACIEHGAHLVTVSYRDQQLRDMSQDAMRHGVLILCENGLDPGIDHMSAMAMISRIRKDNGIITAFRSYGSGIPAPDSITNPLKYVITWNPRNVVMAGEYGAQYLEKGYIKVVPWHQLFRHTWPVEVDGIGVLEAYPNRDSLSYQQTFGLKHARTMIRGTLRWPGWSETWLNIVRIGLPNEKLRIPNLKERTYAEVVEMFMPHLAHGVDLEDRVASFLNVSPTGRIMENMRWLGLFSNEKIDSEGETAAEMMTHLLNKKLALTPQCRDMVILLHDADVEYPDGRKVNITSTFIEYGERGGFTAMAKTVGLPAALAVKIILQGDLPLTGCHLPTHPSIYEPILAELSGLGFKFVEKTVPMVEKTA